MQEEQPAPTPRAALGGGAKFAGVVVVVTAIGAALLLAFSRNHSAATDNARRTHDAADGPIVRAVAAVPSAASHHLVLLGEAHPYASVTLYAKVSGYLKSISVDKGDAVKAGDVLAIIESPETDASWNAAKADHDQRALSASRVRQLVDRKYASVQEADQATADEAMARERLSSLTQQREFEKIKSPFDGTVTARFADPGALVQNAASSQTSALPVVTVDQISRLRVYAYLDQADAAPVHPGLAATITMEEQAGTHIPAHITRTSGELDPRTRKMLVELDVDNEHHTIVPGSFVHVELDVPAQSLPEIPAEALVVRKNKTAVMILNADSTVHAREVTVAVNDGRRVRIASGLAAGERVVLSAGDALGDGTHVRPAADSAKAGAKP